MAPRAPETRANVLVRLRYQARSGGPVQVRFGGAHHTHALVGAGGRWLLQRLVADPVKIEAFRAQHHRFMPEDAEDLAEPAGPALLEADSVEGLISLLEGGGWPET